MFVLYLHFTPFYFNELILLYPDDTILDLWQAPVNRPPIDTHHPAVRTHPVTALKALNVNPGFVSGFAELKKVESDRILDFVNYHIHSGDDHAVRWKWEVGSVAMWDNRYSKIMILF
jgi:alpha-ketoglutarate-dependent taurine dioxygenase